MNIRTELAQVDPAAASTWAQWHAVMAEKHDGFLADDKARGALVGWLTNIVGHLEYPMKEAGYTDPDPRHLVTALLVGHGAGSSKRLTDGQVHWLLRMLTEQQEDGYIIRPEVADAMRALAIAAIKARVPLPIPEEPQTPQEVQTMAKETEVVTEVGGMPHLKTVSITYERKLNLGDYNSATVGVSYWADLDEDTDVDAALALMWDHAKAQVKAQALPLVEYAHAHGVPNPTAEGPPAPAAGAPPPAPAAGAPPPAPAATTPSPPPGAEGTVKRGTSKVTKLLVQADGKIEFYLEGFRWPFTDSRGAEVVIGLFDQQLGWTVTHLLPGAMYTPEQYGTLYADWEKPGKYYDIVRVHT